MSPEALKQILKLAELSTSALLRADEAAALPQGTLEELIALGLLREEAPATAVVCRGCDMQCLRRVEIAGAKDKARAIIYCDQRDDMGPIEVPLESLRRWSVDVDCLADSLARQLSGGQAEEIAVARLWWLGPVAAGESRADVFLARGTRAADASSVFAGLSILRTGPFRVVLTLADATAEGTFPEGTEIVPISRVLSSAERVPKVAKRAITDAIHRAQRRLRVARPGPAVGLVVVLSIKQEGQQAQFYGEELSLSVRLFRLLVFLAQRATQKAGGWVPREDIHDVLWPRSPGEPRLYLRQVDDVMSDLRNALNAVKPDSGKRLIITRREGGYRLRLNPLEIELS